jgi:thioredoxin 1
MQPIFEDLSKEFADKYAFVEVDIDAAASLTDEYNVKGVPTIVIIKDGKEVGRQVGAQSKDALKNTIQNALGK